MLLGALIGFPVGLAFGSGVDAVGLVDGAVVGLYVSVGDGVGFKVVREVGSEDGMVFLFFHCHYLYQISSYCYFVLH